MSEAIPKGWSVKSFYQLGRIANGQVDPRLEPYRRMVLVAPDHIESGTGRIAVEYTAEELGAISGKYLVQPNDVIYSKIRPNLQKLALADKACLCSADMYPITAKEGVSPHFLKFVLLSENFTNFAISVSARSGMPKINRQEIGAFTTAVPDDPDEQQAIAAALSDADGVVAGLERVITKKRLIKQGAAQDLLTARRRLPGFSGEWEVKRLGDVARIATGGRNNQDKDPMGQYPFFVRSDSVERIRSFSYDCEAILVPGEGRIGEIFHYINGRFDVHQRVYCISAFSEETSGRFIYFVLRQFFGAHAMINTVKATVDSLRRPTFTGFELRCPPSLSEQQAIAAVLSDMDAEIQTLESRLAKARAVKEGMMQNLLTGRVRLV
ncbi:restriction endonuclease subunit S [Paenirhodobacter sp. CAU 1674]|uniref:restriction endonuclease subunit S n=1 Tax=Paenirhodobacter sp. CAU 1674 TaxID=3032596 RepID=UPI0023DC5C2D|nr:restriction endonuclease subunit S [Paenirhodobacter sp. CAU 1674]MDF2142343.1 restriction endonuclease subunit S [Paenirhodobacter sp. CAU 1674]